MNLRPSGYEPDELPDCSTPRRRRYYITGSLHINIFQILMRGPLLGERPDALAPSGNRSGSDIITWRMNGKHEIRRWAIARLLAVAFFCLVILLLPAGILLADPGPGAAPQNPESQAAASLQLQDLQAQAGMVQYQVGGLDHDLELLVEKEDATKSRTDDLTLQLADSRHELDDARALHNAEENQISARLTAIYKAGNLNIMDVLLNSGSLTGFYEQALYMAKVSEQDQKLENQFTADTAAMQTLVDSIDRERKEQLGLLQKQEEQEAEIHSKIAERQAALAAVDSQVKQIIAEQEMERRAEQARMAAQAAAELQGLQINNQLQAEVIRTALQYLGVPYVWGGESPQGFDCSGLTKYVFAQFGLNLPHNAAMQFNMGTPVTPGQLQPGDLVFWGPGNPYHVGLYIGSGKFIEAPSFGETVRVSALDTSSGDYAGARRYPLKPPVAPLQ